MASRDLLLSFIFVAFMAIPIAIATAEEVPAHVVISAVYPDASAEDNSEWIELYLIADAGFSTGKANPSWPAADLEEDITLRNGDGLCRLNNSGSIVDTVGWGTATTNETANAAKPAQGESIERKSLNGGYAPCQDTDVNSIDFFVQDTPTPKNASSANMDPAPVELFDAAGNREG